MISHSILSIFVACVFLVCLITNQVCVFQVKECRRILAEAVETGLAARVDEDEEEDVLLPLPTT